MPKPASNQFKARYAADPVVRQQKLASNAEYRRRARRSYNWKRSEYWRTRSYFLRKSYDFHAERATSTFAKLQKALALQEKYTALWKKEKQSRCPAPSSTPTGSHALAA